MNSIFALFLIVVGIVNLRLIYKASTDEDFGRNYIRTSPKAFIWRKIFGEEKAYEITRKDFIPIGLLVSIAIIIVGLVSLFVN
jgi:hypothetical protein